MASVVRTGAGLIDSIAGGLPAQGNHLAYGDAGTGKSSLALFFLDWGLKQGESVLLVTRRIGQDVLNHADALSLTLRPALRSGKLLLMEYTPDIVERATRVKEFSQILDEFAALVRGRKITRIVFDPLTPLIQGLNVSEAAFRARSLVERLGAYGATSLFLVDLPEGAGAAAGCRDSMQSLLRFEFSGDESRQRMLVVERLPGAPDEMRRVRFAISPDAGFVEVAADQPAAGVAGRRKILVVSGDAAVQSAIRHSLGEDYDLAECNDAIQAAARLAVSNPDLLLVDADAEGDLAMRTCLELRKNQLNIPILAIGEQHKRMRDRLGLLAQGIDEYLDKPVDGRMLRVRAQMLLKRYTPRQRFQTQEPDDRVLAALERPAPAVQVLPTIDSLREALLEEMNYSRDRAVPLSVCVIRLTTYTNGRGLPVDAILQLARPHDRLFAAKRSITVLLPETSTAGANAFVRRVQAGSPALAAAEIEIIPFDGSENFVHRVLETAPQAPAAAADEQASQIEAT